MNMPSMLALFICLQEACTAVTGTRWLLITTLPANRIRKETDCDGFNWLEKRQKTVCRRNLEMMETIRRGAIEAVDQCQQQFVSRRWNCSVAKRNGNSTGGLLGKVMNFGTREAAFVHALSSAGVAHSVTRACSSGTFERCGCDGSMAEERTAGQDRATNPSWHSARVAAGGSNFEWAGCSDNVAYGTALSRSFVDGREKIRGKTAMRGLMNLHNNRAGLKAVEESVQTQCKCHGVSGSCEMKTCWRSLAKFHTVAATLKDKFDGAIEVEERRTSSKRELAPRITQFRPPTESDLVYLDASPDFCEPDPKTGSLGTHLRLCNRTSKGMDGCELMCCGRGFNTRRTIVKERCHCKFHWCCSVKCQTCQKEVEEHFCR